MKDFLKGKSNQGGLNPFISLIISISVIWSCSASNNEQKSGNGKPEIQFSQTEFDFGNIAAGEIVSHRFIFKNNGTAVLRIENVIVSCGCTVVNYSKEPVAKGDESFIEVSFNSSGYNGLQKKDIEVYSNCDSSKNMLTLWANVIRE
jgi:hypothetical protein